MMQFSRKSTVKFLTLLIVSTVSIIGLFAHNVSAKYDLTGFDHPTQKSSETDAYYREVRNDLEGTLGALGQDYYVTYRLVERIARANSLDEHPWRIRVSTEQNLNAFASDLNMLTFEGGLFEQLSGDHAAMACVVGHEMAHHTENHIAERTEISTRINQLQEEALIEAREEVASAGRNSGIFGALGQVIGNVLGSTIGGGRTGILASNIINTTLNGLSESQAEQAVARAEELYNERVESLQAEFSETLHQQESESDAVGYEYTVRAGFEPSGCSRVMTVLSRTESSRLPSFSHPRPEDRLSQVNALNSSANNQRLDQEGEANLRRSQKPLGYGVARDQGSLRIESRYGSRDIDSGFPD